MKVDERIDDPRPWKKRSSYQEVQQLWGRSFITEHTCVYKVRKHLAGSKSLEGTGSEWAAGTRPPRGRLWCSAGVQS